MEPKFVADEIVDFEESLTCEFKEVRGQPPVAAIGRVADEYVVGFLNAVGGSVYWGIRDTDRRVTGVPLDSLKRNELLQVIGQKLAKIAPPLPPTRYFVPFHPVFDRSNEGARIPDTFVVEVRVLPNEAGALYLTGSGEGYRRNVGGTQKLSGAELLSELMAQLSKKANGGVTSSAYLSQLEELPSVARRTKYILPLLANARILWVDDRPENNLYERALLGNVGVSVDAVASTEEALYMCQRLRYDLIVSDMERGGNHKAGIELARAVTLSDSQSTPLIFYVGNADPTKSVPTGAFGITSRPDELLHLVFDVLERR